MEIRTLLILVVIGASGASGASDASRASGATGAAGATGAYGLGAEAAPIAPLAPWQGPSAQQPELIERTLAIVAGQAITLSDVQTAQALELVPASADAEAVTDRLIERALMLREAERYTPSEPDEYEIDRRLSEVTGRRPKPELDRVLRVGGFTEDRLREWVRDDLRIAAYLNQRFPAAAAVAGQTRAELIDDWVADLRRRTPVIELWRK